MAGAGYKLFNTGDVLTAAQVNTYLQEQAVMRFANSTARTTALSGVLAEGMVSYLDDTNAVEVYNGSAWVSIGSSGDITGVTAGTGISGGGTSGDVTITNSMATAIDAKGDLIVGTGADTFSRLEVGATNGHVLTVDSSTSTGLKYAAVSATSGLTLITSTTLSGAASKNVDSVFTSTYKFYLIKYVGQSSNANDEIYLRFRTGGTTNTNASYYKQSINLTSTTVSGVTDTTGQTSIYLGDADTTNESHFEIFVYNPELAKRTVLYCLTGGSYGGVLYTKSMRALFANTTSFDGFNIGSLNHNNTAEIRVYGYQD